MPNLNGAQAIVEVLLAHGVYTVFGIPGIQLDPLFDALYASRDRIRTVHPRHEQGAAFMAMGYAQATGRVGVFTAVPGPGMLNAMAAVSTAVAAGQPVLCITGQIPSYRITRPVGCVTWCCELGPAGGPSAPGARTAGRCVPCNDPRPTRSCGPRDGSRSTGVF